MNFISGRVYNLKVSGIEHEESFQVHSGVPQGSHIGPLLFIIFTADIVSCVRDTGTLLSLYADDTKFYRIVNNVIDCNSLQKAVDEISNWSETNKLDLNSAKIPHVTYCGRRITDFNSVIYVNNQAIQKTDNVRDLGVYFDCHMNFGYHIDQITARAKAIFGLGYRFVKELNHPGLILKIFDDYVAPILEYCSFVWNKDRIGVSKRLEQMHHSAMRFARGLPYRTDAFSIKVT